MEVALPHTQDQVRLVPVLLIIVVQVERVAVLHIILRNHLLAVLIIEAVPVVIVARKTALLQDVRVRVQLLPEVILRVTVAVVLIVQVGDTPVAHVLLAEEAVHADDRFFYYNV